MIVLNLICANQHRFEGWFASNDDFATQEAGRLTCPICGVAHVAKLPAAPYVRRGATLPSAAPAVKPAPAAPEACLWALFKDLMKNSEDVGERFPEEARKMHYAETPPRGIHGKSSLTETLELLEEGIPVLPLPLPPEGELH